MQYNAMHLVWLITIELLIFRKKKRKERKDSQKEGIKLCVYRCQSLRPACACEWCWKLELQLKLEAQVGLH